MAANEGTMLALRKTAPYPGVELVRTPLPPSPAPGEVIIEVAAAGICGSDLHIDEWTPSYAFLTQCLPVTLGHEFAGRISAVGQGVEGWRIGDAVTVKPSAPCGKCAACLDSRPDDCTNRRAVGLHQDGAFAPYVTCPAGQLLALPPGMDPILGALAEPLSISAAAIRNGEVRRGQRVVVFGPGTIGQGCALLARRAGAEVTVIGHNDAARFATLRNMGFDRLIDLADDPAALNSTGPNDVAIEAAGAPAAVNLAIAALRLRGTMVAVGIHAKDVPIDLTQLTRRQLSLVGSARGTHDIWLETIAALGENPDLFAKMVTHRLPLTQALEGFAAGHRREASKVLLLPGASA